MVDSRSTAFSTKNSRCEVPFMRKRYNVAPGLLICLALLFAPISYSQSTGKKKVSNQADLPRFSYPVAVSASDLVQSDDATFNAFASRVRADLESVFRDYDIDDKATLRTLLGAKLDLQELSGEYASALQTVEALRALEEKPAAKLTTGLFARAPPHAPRAPHSPRRPRPPTRPSTPPPPVAPPTSRLSPGTTNKPSIRCPGTWCRTTSRLPTPVLAYSRRRSPSARSRPNLIP